MSQRRSGTGPGGSRRPGRRDAARTPRPRAALAPQVADETAGGGETRRRRPRLTGRSLVLVLVVAVLAVSYASSMKAYLQQRAHIADLKEQIAERSADIDALEREKRRWNDEAFVRAQARDRFGYLMPGETAYVVLDEDGKPIETRSQLHDPDEVLREPPKPWWEDAWTSVELAGDPPRERGLAPASELDAPGE
ncbi:FtsB family cell division protein [Nocardioides sp. GXQ0305]|uniref:FtsB family cell division protein n=1 Tax=Nocardioides sp. GXQ0305 TaxID=3423912 RepID=UPI003D7EACA2